MYPDQQNIDLIKKFLYRRGFSDVGSYKEKYLARRLAIRMRKRGVSNYADYYDVISKEENEVKLLKKCLSINVTEFFRDLDTWEEFRKILASYIKEKTQKVLSPSIRIWSAGCAVGPEPYSIACIVHDILGRKLLKHNVKVFATDFNEELLQVARRGIYEGDILNNVPNEFSLRYFEKFGKGQRVKYNVRRMVDFSHLDLLKDKFTFTKLDIIFCRNVLIYFAKETQKSILRRFFDLLVPEGFLILGRTEILHPSFRESFEVSSLRHRIYKKKLDSDPPPRDNIPRRKKELRCEKCRERFDRLVDLRLHERKGTCRMYRCHYCPKEFDSEIRLRAHLKYFH